MGTEHRSGTYCRVGNTLTGKGEIESRTDGESEELKREQQGKSQKA